MGAPASPAPAPVRGVTVVDAAGRLGEIDPSELAEAEREGYRVASSADLEAARQARYGGLGGAAAATGLGALRGATVGLSDAAITALGGDRARAYVEGVKEANPVASTAGEVVGYVAPALVGDEAGLAGAARLLTAPARAVGAVGRAAEGLAGRVVGTEARGLGARMLARGAQIGAQGAAEGTLIGVGSQISEDALADHATTASNLLAAAGHGALFGAVGGAAVGAGAEAAAAAAGALARKGAAFALEKGAGKLPGESLAEFLDRQSGARTWAAAGPTKGTTKSVEAFYEGGASQLGKDIRDEVPSLLGREGKGVAWLTRDDLATAAERGLEKHGRRLGELIDGLDAEASATGSQARALEVVGDAERIAEGLRATPGKGTIAARIQGFADDIKRVTGLADAERAMTDAQLRADAAYARGQFREATAAGKEFLAAKAALEDARVSFRQLRDFRRAADDLWTTSKANPDLWGAKEQFHALRGVFEMRLEKAAEGIAGKGWLEAYKDAKRGYQRASYLEEATKSGIAAEGTNRAFSLTDNVVGTGAAQIGAAIGSALGPAGAAAGAALGGGLGAIVNKTLVRKHGDLVGAEVMRRASLLDGLRRNDAAVSAQIGDGVRKFFSARLPERALLADTSFRDRREVEGSIERVKLLAASPESVSRAVAARLGPDLGREAPGVAAQAAETSARAVAFLAAKVPTGIGSSSVLASGPRRYTETEIAEMRRYLRAARAPLQTLLAGLERGSVSVEAAEFLRDVHPETFAAVGRAVSAHVARLEAMGRPLPYDRRMRLGVLLDAVTDDTLDPQFMAAVQAAHAAPPAPDGPATGAPASGGRPVKSQADTYATRVDRLEAV